MKIAMAKQVQRRQWTAPLALGVLLLLTLWLYRTAVFFDFFWDDPIWYGHAVGKSWWQTILPTTEFQFYRPLSTLYVWLFMQTDGTFATESLHRFQIGYHLVSIVLAYAIGRRLALRQDASIAIAALFAFYPFSYQAVAWAAPNQPMANMLQCGAWLAYLYARPLPRLRASARPHRWLAISLFLYLAALMVQESSVAVSIVPLLYEFIVLLPITGVQSFKKMLKAPRAFGWWTTLLFPLAGITYFIIWMMVPRHAGITRLVLDERNLLYLSQGMIYPLVGRIRGYPYDYEASQIGILILFMITVAVLVALAIWRRRGRVAVFGLLWASISIAPILVGLEFAYINPAARLFYAPAMGVVLLWVTALWPSAKQKEPMWVKVVTVTAVLLICLQSIWFLRHFSQLWQPGISHLQEAVTVLHEQENGRFLFLNFPDRYTPKQEPYPIGYWGMTLAPVSVKLDDFPPVLLGKTAVSQSQAMPWVGQMERDGGPNIVDMRGSIIQPNELAVLAENVDEVYLSHYLANGRFQLQAAGHYAETAISSCETALFAQTICLHNIAVTEEANTYKLTLTWSTTDSPPPEWTIFAHLANPGQPPLAQADGDTWAKTLPLTNWPTDRMIMDYRYLSTTENMNGLVWQIGVYNWVTGERVNAINAQTRQPLPDDIYTLIP